MNPAMQWMRIGCDERQWQDAIIDWVIRRVFSEKLILKLYLSEKATASSKEWGGMGEHPSK